MQQANNDHSLFREFQSAEDAEKWASIHFESLYDKTFMSGGDFDLLAYYSGGYHKVYNYQLRFGEEFDDETTQEISRLTNILTNHVLPENVIAYRHTETGVIKKMCGETHLCPGMRFSDKAFLSTTLLPPSVSTPKLEHHCNCVLKLYLPKGLNAVYISLKNTGSVLSEQELLLNRNILFEIEKIHRFRYPLLIECKAIPNTSLEEDV